MLIADYRCIGFDIDPKGEWLIAGDQVSFHVPFLDCYDARAHDHVSLTIHRMAPSPCSIRLFSLTPIPQLLSNQLARTRSLPVSCSVPYFLALISDSLTPLVLTIEPIGATFFHPNFPHTSQIVTCSGTRKFPLQGPRQRRSEDEDDDASSDESESEGKETPGLTEAEEEDGKDSLQVFTLR